MTTQPEPAVGSESPVELSPEDRLNAAFDDPQNHQEEEDPAPVEGEETDELTEDDIPPEEEADDLPPIDAPVSWDGEAKEVFKNLPREAQEIVQKREADRERFVQQKSQEATRARQEVEQEATQALAAYERQVSEHLQQYARQPNVQKPDPALLASDPVTYAYQARLYEDDQAQRYQAQQVSEHYARQAQEREQQAEQAQIAEQRKLIVDNFPEYADPTTHEKHRNELSAIARELGYPPELISQARATDILAMRKVAEYKSDAEKYRNLQKGKMEKVRAAKNLPRVAKPGAAQAPGAARQNQYATDREALRQGDGPATQRVLDSFFTKSK